MPDTFELTLQMGVLPISESSKWRFVLQVEGFQTEEQAKVWMDKHRETLVEETFLRLKDRPND